MDAFVAAIRPGLHNMFTLELTYNGQSVQIPNQLTIKDALFELARWCVKNDIDISTLKPKKCSYKVYQTKKGKFEVRQHTNGKDIYIKTFKHRVDANRFIEGKDILEQSIMNDLKRENTQLQQENERLRTELEKALDQIPQKRSVNHGDLLDKHLFGCCPKCHEPFVVRHLSNGLPFKGCSQYERNDPNSCRGTQAFTEDECRRLKFDEAEIQLVIEDQKGGKKKPSKKAQKLGSEFDLTDPFEFNRQ